jgi:hypothetical protein
MLKHSICAVGALLAAFGGLVPAHAQDAVMNEFYGNGVHNFYDRDFFQAMQNLSVAIDGGSKDPRAYYYRGLAKLRTGDTWGAHADMQMGAQLEAADIDQFYPVARSLERVQGAERRQLEKYRALARAQARERQMRRDAVRYEQRRRDEAQVLRSVPVGPAPAPLGAVPATAVEPVPPTAPATPPATPPAPADEADDNPFGAPADEAPAEEPAPEMPADDLPGEPAEDADPFGDVPAAESDADVDPFADDTK